MPHNKKIVILFGALPDEAPLDELDTLAQVDAVTDALDELGWKTQMQPLTLNLESAATALKKARPKCVFNLTDSVAGKGNLVALAPLLLEHLHLPYTGACASAMLATTDKLLAKKLMRAADIPTPDWIAPEEIAHGGELEGAYIVKSVMEDASVGIDADSVVTTRSGLQTIAEDRHSRYGGQWFAERFIEGREFNISLLDGEVLPIAEMEFHNYPEGRPKIVDYSAKWEEGTAQYKNTVRRFDFPPGDAGLLKRLEEVSRACWQAFGLSGYARVDFRVDGQGKPYVLEVNANPCITPDAGFPAAAAKAGLDFTEVVDKIVKAALGRG